MTTSSEFSREYDVVVVGGGPVGMMLAAELRLAGVDVAVLERLAERSPHSKAFGLHARSLEVLDRRGLVDRFRAGARSWANGHFAGLDEWVDFSVLDSSHPYALLVQQTKTEQLLEERAVELGADVLRRHEVSAIQQDDNGVTVDGQRPEGAFRFRAKYVVGCDGARSLVRKTAGIDFPGSGGRVTARLGDVRLREGEDAPMGMERTERGLLFCVPLEEGYHRVATFDFAVGKDPAEELTLDELTSSMREIWGTDHGAHDARWLSWFTDSARLADTYRNGRLLIAGDAAHVHFPVGGQGLNLGLQDAFNLGWKLAAAVAGTAPSGLLDSYTEERRAPAAKVLENTRAQIALMNPDPDVTALRGLVTDWMRLGQVNHYIAEMLTGVGVRYDLDGPEHPLLGVFAADLQLDVAGESTRLSDLMHDGDAILLDLGGLPETAEGVRDWAAEPKGKIRVVEATCADRPELAAVLIRPDGYVAWAADRDGTEVRKNVNAALERWFGQG